MRRRLLLTIVMVAACALPSFADQTPAVHSATRPPQSEPLFQGLGSLHHPVTTRSARAQKYFDQGLSLVYAFNHDEAQRSFEEAVKLDPSMAMGWWGIALTTGPNINLPEDPDRGKVAYDAIQKARSLEGGANDEERALIDALAKRYVASGAMTTAQQQAYADAMRQVWKRYRDDPDVAALFAESLMDLHPWQLWTKDGKPGADTPEIVATLETVLAKHPEHMGANHYYIHTVEASATPERGLPSAHRLATLAPAAGHLVHMPAHI
jgi:tetratricopeptide (TPR) repeat protein